MGVEFPLIEGELRRFHLCIGVAVLAIHILAGGRQAAGPGIGGIVRGGEF